jgi:hypothetical protein
MRISLRIAIAIGAAMGAGSSIAAAAADGKGMRFWNLTSVTLSSVQLSPSGADKWGKNQCLNDPDGAVDHDERLKITGVAPGTYDVKLANKQGRVCIVRNIELKSNAVFSIEDKDLTNCTQ